MVETMESSFKYIYLLLVMCIILPKQYMDLYEHEQY